MRNFLRVPTVSPNEKRILKPIHLYTVYRYTDIMKLEQIQKEVKYKTARSSGSGGQHVNKVETKIELCFDVEASEGLSETEKHRLQKNLATRISKEGIFKLAAQDTRSQVRNKELAWVRFVDLLKGAVKAPKHRKKVRPLVSDREKRLNSKRINSGKKAMRGKVRLD